MRLPALLLAAALVGGCSAEAHKDEGAPAERGATKPAPVPARLGTAQKSSTPEGDVTVTAYAYRALASTSPPERRGYGYAGVDIRTCLTRAAAQVSVSWAPWSLRFADDTVAEPVTTWSDDAFRVPLFPAVDRQVRAGQCVRGWAVFEVPAGKRPAGVVYAPSDVSAAPAPLEWAVP